ncbi:hypothetical protein BASA60_010232 [Batrachochytrium salamandrivorans]|nr:hypothetical protein BASA60_010232 [Batrachochytrium salamandrivorans]
MSIILAISLIAVTLLFLEISSYVSIWWYHEADHSEQDTSFEFSHDEPSWNTSELGVCQPYFQPLPMPSSSFLVREADERIRDLHMRSEMQAHSHRAMPTWVDLYSYTSNTHPNPLTHPIQLHGIDLPSVSQYEYLGVIIDDLLTLSPWLAKKKRAITAAAHSISPLLRNNFLSTRYRLTIFNGLVLGVAYYGLELIGGNSTLARRLQAPVNTGIRMILKAPLIHSYCPNAH